MGKNSLDQHIKAAEKRPNTLDEIREAGEALHRQRENQRQAQGEPTHPIGKSEGLG